MPVCVEHHSRHNLPWGGTVLICDHCVVTVAQYRYARPVQLLPQGNTRQQIHLQLFVLGQRLIQVKNFRKLDLHLLAVVYRNAVGQLGNQVLNGTDPTDKRTRCAGISRNVSAGITMLVQTGQRFRDAAAVLCACMRAQNRSSPLRVLCIRIALGRMYVRADCFCCVAAVIVNMSTFLFQYRRSIPTLLRVYRMVWTEPVLCARVRGKSPYRTQVQAQRQGDNETQHSAFHGITSQTHEEAVRTSPIYSF